MSSSNAKKIFDEFFQNLKELGDRLSKEDVDVAVESLQIALDDLKHIKREIIQQKSSLFGDLPQIVRTVQKEPT